MRTASAGYLLSKTIITCLVLVALRMLARPRIGPKTREWSRIYARVAHSVWRQIDIDTREGDVVCNATTLLRVKLVIG